MSQQQRAGKTIRQSYAAFWKEWIILAIGLVLIGLPGMITGWAESKMGPEVFEGLPIEMIIRGVGILAAVYALIFKVGYDLLANRYTLTNEEVVEIYGIIQKHRRVTKLEHIRRVSVEIGIMGRILGFGDVLYFTAGSGGADIRLRDIPNPEALAKEADDLAKRKQAQVKEEGGEEPRQKGSIQQAAASGQILDAFKESVTESVAVQREILKAIQELRAETRRSASTLSAAMSEVRGPGFGGGSSATESESQARASDSDNATTPAPSTSEHDASDETYEPDSGDAFDAEPHDSEFEEWESGPEDESYSPTPKMFDGDWEDILAPGKASDESGPTVEGLKQVTRPALTEDREPKPASEPECAESDQDKEQTDVPVADDEFVGLINPRKQ